MKFYRRKKMVNMVLGVSLSVLPASLLSAAMGEGKPTEVEQTEEAQPRLGLEQPEPEQPIVEPGTVMTSESAFEAAKPEAEGAAPTLSGGLSPDEQLTFLLQKLTPFTPDILNKFSLEGLMKEVRSLKEEQKPAARGQLVATLLGAENPELAAKALALIEVTDPLRGQVEQMTEKIAANVDGDINPETKALWKRIGTRLVKYYLDKFTNFDTSELTGLSKSEIETAYERNVENIRLDRISKWQKIAAQIEELMEDPVDLKDANSKKWELEREQALINQQADKDDALAATAKRFLLKYTTVFG